MASPSENLATSLEILKQLQGQGIVAIQARQMTRTHRQRLLKNGFISEVMKGWYIAERPDAAPGESTAWYASFWGFCADYLNARFGNDWCLAPEQSLCLHAGDCAIPRQILVRSSKGGNKPTALPHNTSLFDVRLALPAEHDIETQNGLRIFRLPAALVAASPTCFVSHPTRLRAALSAIKDADEVLEKLLAGGHSIVAGRLAGAFRNMGRGDMADQIIETLRAAGYSIQESDPFTDVAALTFSRADTSPSVNRMRMDWQLMRNDVLAHFKAPPPEHLDSAAYLRQVDEMYAQDAYNSLSIEGYQVSAELIERVRAGNWNPDQIQSDRNMQDALAARGYWQSFQQVKLSVAKVLAQANAGLVVNSDHRTWHRELFGPAVIAGLLKPADLAGYRSGSVFIRHSMHVPPRPEAVRDLMPALFELLHNEPEPAVRAVLGHFMFVFIHPYFDGNGRLGRFLMNVMLASGGYPWTVVRLDRRSDYMAALEQASVEKNIVPFTQLIAEFVNNSVVSP